MKVLFNGNDRSHAVPGAGFMNWRRPQAMLTYRSYFD